MSCWNGVDYEGGSRLNGNCGDGLGGDDIPAMEAVRESADRHVEAEREWEIVRGRSGV